MSEPNLPNGKVYFSIRYSAAKHRQLSKNALACQRRPAAHSPWWNFPVKSVGETVYTPDPPLRNPWGLLQTIFRDNWERRELCAQLFWRNIKAQYRQTFFGFLWIFFPAIASSMVWLFLHSFRVIQFDREIAGGNYLLYLLVGMVLWQSFVEAFSMPLAAFNANRGMLQKINFPREIVMAVSMLEVLFNSLVRTVVLLPFLIYFVGLENFSLTMLWFPLFHLILILVGSTIGLFLVPIGALYLDVGRILTIIAPVWMILTPVIYPVPTEFPATLLIYCNSAAPALISAREALLGAPFAHAGTALISAAIAFPAFIIGLILFRISIPIILERQGN